MQVSWPPMDSPSTGYPSIVIIFLSPLLSLGAETGSPFCCFELIELEFSEPGCFVASVPGSLDYEEEGEGKETEEAKSDLRFREEVLGRSDLLSASCSNVQMK